MAFAAKAREYIRSNVATAAVQMSIDDAVIYLEKATKADPELARDALVPLAEAAWYGQKLEVGRTAADAAVKRTPDDADAQFMLGRIALSQFSAAKDDPEQKAQADAHWEVARAAFTKAGELLDKSQDPARADTLARVRTNLGHAYVWKDQVDLATKEYARAIVAKPSVVEMAQIRTVLGPEKFLATLEDASAALAAKPGASAEDLAAESWWLGWARYDLKQYDKADDAFSAAVAKNPAIVNAWFFIAMSRFHRSDMDGALAAFRRHFDENPSDLVGALDTTARRT
jgi:tetratricopeptide (TPR) repeat protein